jgi:hypothetical protein
MDLDIPENGNTDIDLTFMDEEMATILGLEPSRVMTRQQTRLSPAPSPPNQTSELLQEIEDGAESEDEVETNGPEYSPEISDDDSSENEEDDEDDEERMLLN